MASIIRSTPDTIATVLQRKYPGIEIRVQTAVDGDYILVEARERGVRKITSVKVSNSFIAQTSPSEFVTYLEEHLGLRKPRIKTEKKESYPYFDAKKLKEDATLTESEKWLKENGYKG